MITRQTILLTVEYDDDEVSDPYSWDWAELIGGELVGYTGDSSLTIRDNSAVQ